MSGQSVWLVTGATGQVGSAIIAAAPSSVAVIAPTRADLDLADPVLDPLPLIRSRQVTAIVNCAAYTQVDRAEAEPDLAMQVNGFAAGTLAHAAKQAGIPIIQVSTDFVFPGDKGGPYEEDDATGPLNAYGRSKLEGEQKALSSGARHAIVRTSWVFGPTGHNFLRTMIGLHERDEVRVVADQVGCPTHAGDLAKALIKVTQSLERDAALTGIWHVTNSGETSWHGFASRIFARMEKHQVKVPKVWPISTAEYPAAAVRPHNSRLATAKVRTDFGIALRSWQEACDATVDEVLGRGAPA